MPFDPTRSIQDSGDLSPTTLILNQLKTRGVPLNAANVRAAVLANAREGNQAGPDPVAGLRSMAPISSAGDPGVGQGGNVAGKVAPGGGRGGRSRGGATPPADRRDNTSSGAPKTSSPPATYQGPSLEDLILPLAAGSGAVGLGEYARRRAMGGQDFMGNKPMDPTGRMIDINLPGIEGPNIGGAGSQLPQPSVRPGIEGPPPQLGGPGGAQTSLGGQGAAPPVSDMEVAMQRAISPAGSGELDLGELRPMTSPGDVRGPGLPPGVTDVDAARAGIGSGGLDSPRVAGQIGAPDVNLPVRPRAPMPNIANPSGGDIAAQILRLFGGVVSLADNQSEPLRLADGSLVYPGGRVVRPGSRDPSDFVEIPTHREAQRIISATRRRLSELPEVPKTMNAVGVILCYTLYGLDDEEISIATGLSAAQIGRIKVSDPYTQMHETIVRTVLDSETDVVRDLLSKNATRAASVMVDALEAGSRGDRMAAARDILDRSGHRPADVIEHRHRVDGGLVIEYVKRGGADVPTIEMERDI